MRTVEQSFNRRNIITVLEKGWSFPIRDGRIGARWRNSGGWERERGRQGELTLRKSRKTLSANHYRGVRVECHPRSTSHPLFVNYRDATPPEEEKRSKTNATKASRDLTFKLFRRVAERSHVGGSPRGVNGISMFRRVPKQLITRTRGVNRGIGSRSCVIVK